MKESHPSIHKTDNAQNQSNEKNTLPQNILKTEQQKSSSQQESGVPSCCTAMLERTSKKGLSLSCLTDKSSSPQPITASECLHKLDATTTTTKLHQENKEKMFKQSQENRYDGINKEV